MSNTATEGTATEEKTATATGRKGGGYVVLKEITEVGELADLLENEDGKPVFAVYKEAVQGRDAAAAIKAATVGDDTVDEGVYVAVPVGSFKTRQVRQVVQVTLN